LHDDLKCWHCCRENDLMPTATLTPKPKFELQPYKSLENATLSARIEQVRKELGPRLLILGHHYQQDEAISRATAIG
jgi:quinolinate synthase